MPVTVLGESEASSRYYSFGTGSCSPTLRTLGPRSSQIQGPAGHSATCLDLLAPDCCAMWVRICTLAFGTVVSGVEDFASLLGGDRGFERSVARRQSFRGASLLLSVAAFLEFPPARPVCLLWLQVFCRSVSAMPSGVWCTASRVHCILRTCGPGAARVRASGLC